MLDSLPFPLYTFHIINNYNKINRVVYTIFDVLQIFVYCCCVCGGKIKNEWMKFLR